MSAWAADEHALADLIEELDELGNHPCRAHLPMGKTLRDAAAALAAAQPDGEREAVVPMSAPASSELVRQLRGRAMFCRDRAEVKTPGLLTEAAARIEELEAEVERLRGESQ